MPVSQHIWRAAHSGRTYPDVDSNPLPHFDPATGPARLGPLWLHAPAQADSWALSTSANRALGLRELLIGSLGELDHVPSPAVRSAFRLPALAAPLAPQGDAAAGQAAPPPPRPGAASCARGDQVAPLNGASVG
jgi:hypothetical protein